MPIIPPMLNPLDCAGSVAVVVGAYISADAVDEEDDHPEEAVRVADVAALEVELLTDMPCAQVPALQQRPFFDTQPS